MIVSLNCFSSFFNNLCAVGLRSTIFKMAAISKQEHLKRYLSNSEGEKKKKRKKVPKSASKNPTSIIVDDDITVRDIKVQDSAQETNELEDVDEAPAVYEKDGITKIFLESFKKREEDKINKWAPIGEEAQSLPGREVRERFNSDSESSVSGRFAPSPVRPKSFRPPINIL